jgi:stalled ribosome rescue protein Dom34
MSEYFDAIIWIDRHKAKVFHFSASEDVKLVIEHTSAQRRHHEGNHEDSTKHAVDVKFLQSIVQAIDPSDGTLILVIGPGNSKFELKNFIDHHRPQLAPRICGVETLDDPNDAGILALARQFFKTRGHRHMV